jgi:hypothetical protein
MDRVKIKVDSSTALWRHFLGRLTLIWSHMIVRICFVITLFFYFFIAVAITEAPQHKYFILIPVFVVFGMWLSPIVREFIASIVDWKKGETCIIYLDLNSIEFEHSETKVFFSWENFYGFRESKKRFVLFAKRGMNLALAKRYMSEENLSATRSILADTPLEKFS